MQLNTLQKKVLTPFIEETLVTLDRELGLNAQADSGYQEKIEDFQFKGFAVVANTKGSITGRILIHHYTETAMAIGNKLLLKQDPHVTKSHDMSDKISNALADFAQMTLHPAVSKLQDSKMDLSFDQAYFISNTEKMDKLLEGVNEIITMPIRIDNIGRFYINYLIHQQD